MLLPFSHLRVGVRIDSTLDMVEKGYKVAQPSIFETISSDFVSLEAIVEFRFVLW